MVLIFFFCFLFKKSPAYSFLIRLNMAISMRLTSALVPHPLKGILICTKSVVLVTSALQV